MFFDEAPEIQHAIKFTQIPMADHKMSKNKANNISSKRTLAGNNMNNTMYKQGKNLD